jgi:hypothetical protein
MFLKRSLLLALVLALLALLAPVGAVHATTLIQIDFNDLPVGPNTLGSDNIAEDKSGNDRHMVALYGNRNTVTGPGGTTASELGGGKSFVFFPGFDTFNDSDKTANTTDIVLDKDKSYTIEIIATLPQDRFNYDEGPLVHKGEYNPGMGWDEWGIGTYNNGGSQPNTVEGSFIDVAKGNPAFLTGKVSVTDVQPLEEAWHHIALVRDRGADRVALFIDGLEVAFKTGFDGTFDFSNTTGSDPFFGALTLGSRSNRASNRFYRGAIDFFKISEGALTPNQFTLEDRIPEPATVTLLGLGGMAVLRTRRR